MSGVEAAHIAALGVVSNRHAWALASTVVGEVARSGVQVAVVVVVDGGLPAGSWTDQADNSSGSEDESLGGTHFDGWSSLLLMCLSGG